MSEILHIKFGRADRTYRFGDRVTGWVMVRTSRGEDCKAVRLRRFWRTHGKGNEDKGDAAQVTLHRGPLNGDGPHMFEFDFPTPPGPFTYRGRYLNVDHYVEAQVDLPFARDPTVREEYILLPGKPVVPSPILLDSAENLIKNAVPPLSAFIGIASGVIGLSLILTSSLAGLLFFLVGGLLFLPILKKKADERLGRSASARLTSVVVGPGEEVGVDVKVTPPKPVQLNRAIAELTAREICVSGSGSNRRTHRHTVYSGGASLSGAVMLEGGALQIFKGSLRLPDDAPTSFKGSANKLLWEVKVRLDIPSWPDWVKRIPLVVWPKGGQVEGGVNLDALPPPEDEVLEEVPETRKKPGFPEPEPHVTGPPPWLVEATSHQEPTVEVGPSEPETVDSQPTTVHPRPTTLDPQPTTTDSELAALVNAINGAGMFGKERDLLIKDLLGKSFGFDLEVRRVDRSMGIYAEADYRDGRTVKGVLTGSDLEVVVYFPSYRNDEIKDWKPGSVHSVQAEVHDWDRLRKCPELLARG